jgi:hypothetical protein
MVVLRDSARKGQLKVRMLLLGGGFAVLLYAIGLPAGILYSNHPQYKPLFIAAMALDGLLFIAFMFIAIRSYLRSLKSAADPPGPER